MDRPRKSRKVQLNFSDPVIPINNERPLTTGQKLENDLIFVVLMVSYIAIYNVQIVDMQLYKYYKDHFQT